MWVHKIFHPRDEMGKKKRGRGLASSEDSVDTSIGCLKDDIKRAKKDRLQRPETTQTTQGSTT